jgi:exopolysaccharide production protein ExoQ
VLLCVGWLEGPTLNRSGTAVKWIPDAGYSLLLSGLFWLIILMLVPTDLNNPSGDVQNFGTPNPLTRLAKIALLALSAFVILRRARLATQLLRELNPFLIGFMVLLPLSTLWSISPADTVARFTSLLTLLLVCFAFALAGWHARRFQDVVRPVLTLLLVASLLVGAVAPGLVMEKGDSVSLQGAWHGLTAQKNEFGQVASFSVILWLHARLSGQMRGAWPLAGIAISIACLLLSRSSTSMFASALAASLMLILLGSSPRMRRYMPHIVGAFATFTTLYALAVLNLVPGLGFLLEPVTSLTGKDSTFSARTVIWQVIREHIAQSPWLGTGYGAYWVGPLPQSPSYIFLSVMYLYPTESHNGYLEIMNDLGLLGVSFLLGFIVFFLRHALRLMKTDRGQGTLFLALLFQQIIINLSESAWLSRGFSFSVLALASIALSRALLEERLRTEHRNRRFP